MLKLLVCRLSRGTAVSSEKGCIRKLAIVPQSTFCRYPELSRCCPFELFLAYLFYP